MAANRYIFLAVILLLTVPIDDLSACSCLGPFSPAVAFERADAVFSGKVVAIAVDTTDWWRNLRVTIRVSEQWKGKAVQLVNVYTSSVSSACGYPFEKGSSYLVYAYYSEPSEGPLHCDGCLVTSICNRTRSMSEASEDLQYLNDPESGIWFPDPRLYQNRPNPFSPNPFNPVSTIHYFIPATGKVSLIVYNLSGREVIRLVDTHMQEGYHPVIWNGRNQLGREVPSGVYIIRLSTPYYTTSIKMLLLK